MENSNRVRGEFEEPQRAINRGQSAVYYQKDYVPGGGIIESLPRRPQWNFSFADNAIASKVWPLNI